MQFNLTHANEILGRTPHTLRALLHGLPSAWAHTHIVPNTWSVHEVVGHLLHGDEAVWMARIETILKHGEGQPFAPFNRSAMLEKYAAHPLEALLDGFAQARALNLQRLASLNITPEKLNLKGMHPMLGTVSLSNVISTWVVHDLNHVGQIVEVMAHQYREAVGPWVAYLGILQRPVAPE
jgi:uncharacterized damage-inducible protein DinB